MSLPSQQLWYILLKVLIWGLSFALEHKKNVKEQIRSDLIAYVKNLHVKKNDVSP